MKKYLLILIAYSSVSCAQSKDVKIKVDTTKVISSKITAANPDTIKAAIKSTPTIVKVDSEKDTNIILAREQNNATDWAKYLLPIFTLLLGYFINRITEWYNNRKRFIKTGERFIIELRNTIKPLEGQIEELEKFVAIMSTNENNPPRMIANLGTNGEIFKSLDKNELFRYIELKNNPSFWKLPFFRSKEEIANEQDNNVRVSNRTHGHVNILSHYYDTLIERYKMYLDDTQKFTSEFNKNFQVHLIEMRTMFIEYERAGVDVFNEPLTARIVELSNTYIQPHMEDGKWNPYVLRDMYFTPLVKHLAGYRLEEKISNLLVNSTICLNSIAGMQMQRTYVIENMNTLIGHYKETIQETPIIINDLNGNSTKVSESQENEIKEEKAS